jgi:hypothetical protein
MTKDFAADLSARLQSHPAFWDDLQNLQVEGVRCSLGRELFPKAEARQGRSSLSDRLQRMLYCASIFAQTSDEHNKGLAQTIALNALLCDHDQKIRERTAVVLSEIGNFPAVKFVKDHYGRDASTFLGQLKMELLAALNSVRMGESDIALTDFQLEVWGALPKERAAAISAPTSAGKSFVVREFLCQTAVATKGSFQGIYVAPTRALLAEVHRKIADRLGSHAGVRVSTVPALDAESRPKQIFVLTQERLHVLLAVADIKPDLVIVDEAQNLADGARGMILQDCLEKVRELNASAKMILLSPGAEGFTNISQLLGLGSMDVRDTVLSPVLQNRIHVRSVEGEPKMLNMALLGPKGKVDIGRVTTQRGVADPGTRLAAVALELGKQGAALVYATGPVEAEKIAGQFTADLEKPTDAQLVALAEFIKQHIHPDYGLAEMVLHAVAFHYGKMPTLLREALEEAFRESRLRYLVCTTTLFQGVNLPARSVFINTPTRGRGTALDAAHLWNFAGRAGRLGNDLVGNVFLVDYEAWPEQKMDRFARYQINPALSATVQDNFEQVVAAVTGSGPKSTTKDPAERDIRAAAGLMLARASTRRSSELLDRLPSLNEEQRRLLQSTAEKSATELGLPPNVLENNWTVDLHGLQRLARRMTEKVLAGELEELLPVHPRRPEAYDRYSKIFSRIARQVMGYKPQGAARYGGFIANYAVLWMRGASYPALLRKWVEYQKKQSPKASINDMVRKGFDFFEEVLRFQMVQLGKAYVDVLHFVLEESGEEGRRREAFDFSLALELGVSTTTGRAFIELGTSRITAIVLEALFPDSELTPQAARERLAKLNTRAISISPIILKELRQLKLIA